MKTWILSKITINVVLFFHLTVYVIFVILQGIASWLTGTHLGKHIVGKLSDTEVNQRRQHESNWTYILDTAIDNLHKCLWFGIFEKMNQSLEIFKYQTGLRFKMQRFNMGRVAYWKLTNEQRQFLEHLIPIDMFLYEYALQLHNYRWQIYRQQGKAIKNVIDIKLPTMINGCQSDTNSLNCPQGLTVMKDFVEKFNRVFAKKAQNVTDNKLQH